MEERNLRKTRTGVVVSDKMNKTIVVAVRDNVRHPLYNKIVKKDEELDKIRNMIFFLYDYFCKNPEKLPQERKDMIDDWGLEEVVKDQIAGMSDRYAVAQYKELFIPKAWDN